MKSEDSEPVALDASDGEVSLDTATIDLGFEFKFSWPWHHDMALQVSRPVLTDFLRLTSPSSVIIQRIRHRSTPTLG